MQITPAPRMPLSIEARVLLAKLRRQYLTVLFDPTTAGELVEWGYATRTNAGLSITEAGRSDGDTE